MMYRYLLYWSILIIVTVSGGALPERDAVDVILRNKTCILDKLEKDKTIQSEKPDNLFQILNDTLSFYMKKMNQRSERIDSVFISKYLWCQTYMSILLTGTPIITDTINIRFLSNLLRSKNVDFTRNAINILMKKTAFSALETNGTYIKKNVKESSLSESFKLRLLCLLLPDENEKRTIITSPELQFYEKAVVDDVLLDSLILVFKRDTTWNKGLYEGYLLETGKKRAVKVVLENLNNNAAIPCTTSYRRKLLSDLKRYYPQEPLFEEDAPPYLYSKNYEKDLIKNKAYWIRFRAWVLKNYSVTLQDSLPYSHFFDIGGFDISRPKRAKAKLK